MAGAPDLGVAGAPDLGVAGAPDLCCCDGPCCSDICVYVGGCVLWKSGK